MKQQQNRLICDNKQTLQTKILSEQELQIVVSQVQRMQQNGQYVSEEILDLLETNLNYYQKQSSRVNNLLQRFDLLLSDKVQQDKPQEITEKITKEVKFQNQIDSFQIPPKKQLPTQAYNIVVPSISTQPKLQNSSLLKQETYAVSKLREMIQHQKSIHPGSDDEIVDVLKQLRPTLSKTSEKPATQQYESLIPAAKQAAQNKLLSEKQQIQNYNQQQIQLENQAKSSQNQTYQSKSFSVDAAMIQLRNMVQQQTIEQQKSQRYQQTNKIHVSKNSNIYQNSDLHNDTEDRAPSRTKWQENYLDKHKTLYNKLQIQKVTGDNWRSESRPRAHKPIQK